MRQTPLFSKIETGETYLDEDVHATIAGVSIKTGILLAITIAIAVVTGIFLPKIASNDQSWGVFIGVLIAASIIGFIAVIVGRLSYRAAKYASVLYALCEGLVLGTVTCIVEQFVSGVGYIAVAVTLVIFGIMLLLYSTGILRFGSKIRAILIAIAFAGLAIALITTLIILIMGWTGHEFNTSILPILIAIEAFFLLYGVITLVFNFDEANAVVATGASKDAEWSVALGLEVSLVYIYIEVLRLIVLIVASSKN